MKVSLPTLYPSSSAISRAVLRRIPDGDPTVPDKVLLISPEGKLLVQLDRLKHFAVEVPEIPELREAILNQTDGLNKLEGEARWPPAFVAWAQSKSKET